MAPKNHARGKNSSMGSPTAKNLFTKRGLFWRAKLSRNEFSFSDPTLICTWVPLFGVGWGSFKFWFMFRRHFALIHTIVPFPFLFSLDSQTNDGGLFANWSFPRLAPLWGPNGEDLAVFMPLWVGKKNTIG